MKILFVTQRVPYPPDRGDKIATYNIVKFLSQRHEVHVCCLADGREDESYARELSGPRVHVQAVRVNRAAALWRVFWALFSKQSLSVAYLNEGRLHEVVSAAMASENFDAAVVYSSNTAQFVRRFETLPRIMHFSDLDSQKFAQYAAIQPWPLNWLYRLEERRLLGYEKTIAAEFSHSIVCTPRERHDFQQLIPGCEVTCVSNGVDLEYFKPGNTAPQQHHLIFTGVMDYYPNVEGIVWFCRKILPAIQKKFPDVKLTICGARPNRQIRNLSALNNVEVTGRVPDVRTYAHAASVAVVPLRVARGIQNKVLEAMAMGLATVTTSAAANGVDAVPGEDFFIADEESDFAGVVCRLLDDQSLREDVGKAARRVMQQNYSWPKQLARLEEIIETSIAAGSNSP